MPYKETIKKGLYNLKAYKLNALKNQAYIIAYHRVVENPSPFYPELDIRTFEAQIRHLSENYSIVPVEEIVKRITTGQTLKKCLALTFDDGFKDNYTHAYPILKKYNAPATIFLITSCIETGNPPWFMAFRRAFEKTDKKELYIILGGQNFRLNLSSMVQKKAASDEVMSFLQICPNKKRLLFLKEIFDALGPNDFSCLENIMLNWNEIREMANNGVSFGAHTHSHPILANLTISEAEFEITRSKRIIEKKLNKPVNGFAYPVGKRAHYDKKLFSILNRNGFEYAFTTGSEKILYNSNLYEISRPSPWEINYIS